MLEGVVEDEVEVRWEVEQVISSNGQYEDYQGDGEHGRGGVVPVDEVMGRWPVGWVGGSSRLEVG